MPDNLDGTYKRQMANDSRPTSCSAFFRPRNGYELIQAIADGKTCEVPNGWGMKALTFLESRLSNWSIYFDGSTNKGWSILKPTGDTPERFRRYLQNTKADS